MIGYDDSKDDDAYTLLGARRPRNRKHLAAALLLAGGAVALLSGGVLTAYDKGSSFLALDPTPSSPPAHALKVDDHCDYSTHDYKLVETQMTCVARDPDEDYVEITKVLRGRLGTVAELLPTCDATKAVQCTCDDFCRGACFACGCSTCAAAAFSNQSFPGHAALCTDPGPLGTGLLCAVDASSGLTTKEPCCTVGGQYCALPPGSCCEKGSCQTCPKPAASLALYPPLPREFDSSKNTCEETTS